MKIRNGFVSNSSSSSFIVGFTKVPKTQSDLMAIMFPMNAPADILDSYFGNIKIEAIVARVWSDLQMSKPSKVCDIDRELESCDDLRHIEHDRTECDDVDKKYRLKYGAAVQWTDYPDWGKEYRSALNRQYKKYDKEIKQAVKKFKKENWEKLGLEGKKIYIFSYSDNSGEEALEHGGIFENLPHIRISHH